MSAGEGKPGPAPQPDERAAADLFDAAPTPGEKPAAEPVSKRVTQDDDHRLGHRARLRSRFLGAGPEAVADYELLELVLFRAIPRRDVKPLAKTLLKRFGDLAGVLAAEPARLREVDGLGEAAICELKIVEAAGQALARARVADGPAFGPAFGSASAVIDYCRAAMGRRPVEEFRVLFLDRKNRMIADERLGRGTVDQVAVYPREIAKRALELGASGVILVHNHPSGDPEPSRADIDMTKAIARAVETVGVAVRDHIVVGAASAESFLRRGLL